MSDILLAVLGMAGCLTAMAISFWLVPRLVRRSGRIQRLADRAMARLRAQSTIDRMLTWVEAERPDLERATAPDGTVTLLFSDIEGSTQLNDRLGDQRWLQVLSGHNALVRGAIREHEGYEVKAQGDGFMVAFPSARKAIHAAIAIQRAIAGYRHEHADAPIKVRIGLHTGEAIHRGGDFFGKSVALAARIADQGRGGEILVSSLVKELTDSAGDVEFDPPRRADLKGFGEGYTLYPVRWRDGARVYELGRTTTASSR
jgi:class 3 adenylate cyclase